MTFSEHIYWLLLSLYPADYRREYGALMAQHFRDQHRDARRQHRVFGPARVWLHLLPDLVTSLVVEHRESRKGRTMSSTLRIGKVAAFLFLLPSLAALLLLFDPDVLRGEWMPYGVAALIGAGGYLLGRVGLVPPLKFWSGYTAGFLIFSFGFIALNIWSPAMNIGIEALRSSLLVNSRHIVHIVVCLATVTAFYLTAKRYLTPLFIALVVLALNLAMWIILNNTPRDAPSIWAADQMLGYSVTALFVAIMGVRFTRGTGIQSLVAVAAGLGLQLTLYTIDEYRGIQLTLMILLGAFVPLIVCPAWLMLTQNWRVQKYGLLVIWTLMMVGLFAVPQLLWQPGSPLQFSVILYHIGNSLPIWIGLWLALNMYEREPPTSTADDDRPLSAVRAML